MFRIRDLRWGKRYRLPNNGPDSFVIPFATNRPVNVVFHGETKFEYGHYGIHLGQQDQLTFLGPNKVTIKASFIDCRIDSVTFGVREEIEFRPTSGRTLIIPPGVAHTFLGLENVHTLNTYEIYLPEEGDFLEHKSSWNAGSDVVNITLDTPDDKLPHLRPNPRKAARAFYEILRQLQGDALTTIQRQHKMNYDFTDKQGKSYRIGIKKPDFLLDPTRVEAIPGIFGLRWDVLPFVTTGEESGIVPLLGHAPVQIVDHGERYYANDSYGIHLGQEDRLLFLGSSKKRFTARFLDCRDRSPTLHQYLEFEIVPHPNRVLVIPPGVAHGFIGIEGVYTLNRPAYYLDQKGTYTPGGDILDWPYEKRPFPVLKPNRIAAPAEFYSIQAQGMTRFLSQEPTISTASGYLLQDAASGKSYKIVLRRKAP